MFELQLYSISCLNTMSIPFCATYCTLSSLTASPLRIQLSDRRIYLLLSGASLLDVCAYIAPHTSSHVSPEDVPIPRHASHALSCSSMIPAGQSAFICFPAIQITSCRSSHSTTGGVSYCLFLRDPSSAYRVSNHPCNRALRVMYSNLCENYCTNS